MDIKQQLLIEHSKSNTNKIVDHIGNDSKRFAELMRIFFGDEYRLMQRAAWVMSHCAENNPQLIKPYFEKMIDLLPEKDVHNAVKRNIVRLLQFVEIPDKYLGKVYSHCVDLVDNANEPVAVRAFALTVAAKIAQSEQELLSELKLVVEKHLKYTSVAFHKRAREILKNQS